MKVLSIRKFRLFRAGKSSGGFTLVELLSTMFSALLISAAIYSMFYSAVVMWQSSVTRTGNRQDMHVALRKLESELMNSDAATITNLTGNSTPAVSFLSAHDQNDKFITDNKGNPTWQKYVIYYKPNGTKKLLRKEVYGSFTGPLSASALNGYLDGTGRLISGQVTSFLVTQDTGNNSALITISVQDTNKHGRSDIQNIGMQVSLRN